MPFSISLTPQPDSGILKSLRGVAPGVCVFTLTRPVDAHVWDLPEQAVGGGI
jgi:hypothetical protein